MNVELLDGRILPVTDVYIRDGWEFFRVSTGERLTYLIRQGDKRRFWPDDFDAIKSNDEIYQEQARVRGLHPSGPLTTNVTQILAYQLATDPLAAPAEAAQSITNRVSQIAGSPTFLIVCGLVVTALAMFLIVRYAPKPK